MKQLLFVLALMSVAACHEPSVVSIVCDLWSGWGFGFAGKNCSLVIAYYCPYSVFVLPLIIKFLITLDREYLDKAINALYMAIRGSIDRFKYCKYIEYFSHFFTHIINFFKNYKENCELIRVDIAGFIYSFNEGDYYTAGNFLGDIFKIIFAS